MRNWYKPKVEIEIDPVVLEGLNAFSISGISAAHLLDGYKTGHAFQYPDGTEYIFSNLTPRGSRFEWCKKGVISFGLQGFIIEYLINRWNATFFKQPKEKVIAAYRRRMDGYLGKGAVNTDHIEALHDLGYLPVHIKALPEGTRVPLQCPLFTIENTDARFGWITNYLETVISCNTWGASTSATIAKQYRDNFEKFAKLTGSPLEFVPWQGHDFSFRGMNCTEAAVVSGAAHLTSFFGTDTIPAIDYLEGLYGANSDKEIVGGSVAATEHSVMCAGGKDSEIDTYKRLMLTIYPKGIVSIVSDTWDFWNTVTVILPKLKTEIMSRDGKVVIRPDSGDPVKVIIGDPEAPEGSPERKGLIQCLWETFGGTVVNGYKVLDSHIGAIYGDSITLDRQVAILAGLAENGFAASNIVLGIGSFTYQYNTRDSFNFAVKSTHAIIKGESIEIFKDPKTDSKKKSHRGLIMAVKNEAGEIIPVYPVTREEEQSEKNLFETVFMNGELKKFQTLAEIRERIIKA